MQSRYFTINDFPQGTPGRELFELRETELPALAEGEVRIRNTWLSVDPYMRGRMSGVKTYIATFVLGEPLEGDAVGEVSETRAARLAVGDRVRHMAGRRATTCWSAPPAARWARWPCSWPRPAVAPWLASPARPRSSPGWSPTASRR